MTMAENDWFEYLDDGQLEPRIRDWQARLLSAREQVLSVLLQAVEAASVKDAEKRLAEAEAEAREALTAVLQAIDHAAAHMPRPRGFFVGDAERQPTYAASCRLLLQLEGQAGRLSGVYLCLCELLRRLSEVVAASEKAELLLFEVGRAAERNGDGETCQRGALLVGQCRSQKQLAERLHASAREQTERLRRLCQELFPAFCNQSRVMADLEHEGAKCDPIGMLRLCGELRVAINHLSISGG